MREKSKQTGKKKCDFRDFFLIVCVQVNVLNCDNQSHGGYPYPSGSGWNVSEEIKSDFFIFFLSMKVQRKNVLKRK